MFQLIIVGRTKVYPWMDKVDCVACPLIFENKIFRITCNREDLFTLVLQTVIWLGLCPQVHFSICHAIPITLTLMITKIHFLHQ